uniref:Uncharacterized protein n=1 Tax=Oryza sativa subsp. japonica TaxID=39947 RepID=Q6EU33_ORYSJ|nr:hypothetical protein [Oryza sativa Japonica Group]
MPQALHAAPKRGRTHAARCGAACLLLYSPVATSNPLHCSPGVRYRARRKIIIIQNRLVDVFDESGFVVRFP